MAEIIAIEGLAAFSRNLKKLNGDLPKALRMALNEASGIVVDEASRRIPRRTGKAQASLKAKSTRTESRIGGGGNRAPYYAWLDFGGRTGRRRSIKRAFLPEGRYLYASLADKRHEFDAALSAALLRVASEAGIEVT
ncbi:hypothetical protein Rhe02_55680 [Rhizocola hellebori]|uniref:HK97 gp10 family phage protein n=1 Tax=Rhizocola hellebori TaxID=1392758 RepID=A0A8J3QBF7_9ACTN|nr:HK97 gp10 family phage protein [Rhizocola hellebori]GIH07501.1 hypothetical protein Rhe02_55680 [Rhizocola hellebori]